MQMNMGENDPSPKPTPKQNAILVVFVIALIWFATVYPGLRATSSPKFFDPAALADLKNAYNLAQAYFNDHPEADLELISGDQFCFSPSQDITFTIIDGRRSSLRMSSVHQRGKLIYSIDAAGEVSSRPK